MDAKFKKIYLRAANELKEEGLLIAEENIGNAMELRIAEIISGITHLDAEGLRQLSDYVMVLENFCAQTEHDSVFGGDLLEYEPVTRDYDS